MVRFPSQRWLSVGAVFLVGSWSPRIAAAQLISLKTVPVASGDQFLIFPSENLGMGGVSIALDDALLDPFMNPARGKGFGESRMFSSPTFYTVSNRAGSARTIPVGAGFTSPDWFGDVFAALQNLKRGEQFFNPFILADLAVRTQVPIPTSLSSQSATNKYVHLSLGRNLGHGLAVGASVFAADLGALDGVEHLFASAAALGQHGSTTDLRLGLTKEFEGDRTFEVVLLHDRFNMTHDAVYEEWVVVDSTTWEWRRDLRLESNLDHSRTWGAHFAYDQPIGENGWRVGGLFTANRKTHPKIPNYELMNIPRDPGHSNAFNLGVGLAKETEKTRFGLDLVYEPAVSETWAEADGPVATVSGDTIPDRGKTVENSFDFGNAYINLGVSHDVGPVAFQLGLRVSAYDFHLDQWNNVEETFRRQDESWMEWVPSWGATVRLSDLELHYLGRITTGTGRPGVAQGFARGDALAAPSAPNDILLAPQGPLTLQDATVMTHQLSIAVPIR